MAENSVTQRVAAILAADAVGYSRLMADNEPATIAALDEARAVFTEQIESNHGRVVDTAGDSVLAVFETAAGAVLASVAIQERLAEMVATVPADRRMLFRIGIHLGDIHEKPDGTAYGDGVNIAARLEGIAEPGGIAASEIIQAAVEGRVDIGFEFLGKHEVKNIDRPIRVYRWCGIDRHTSVGAPVEADPTLALPDGPSIAVLPFSNMSADPEQEFFADGVTEQIIAEFARFREMFVIARNTTFQFKGQSVDVKKIAEDLGVRYILEGSVRRAGDRIRVTTQLLEGQTAAHLWAETYDRDLTTQDVFEIQDAITEEVVATLAGSGGLMSRTERWQAAKSETNNLRSYECVLLAQAFPTVSTPDYHRMVRDCLIRTVEFDDRYVDAWAWLSYVYNLAYGLDYNSQPDDLDRGLEAAKQAIRLDSTNQMAQFAMAISHYYRGEIDDFISEAEAAIRLNPNNVDVTAELGRRLVYTGHWDRGAALMRKAMALNPLHPSWYWFPMAKYHLVKGELDEAVTAANNINMPDYWIFFCTLAYINAHAGRQKEAEQAAASALQVYPSASIEELVNMYRRWSFPQDFIEKFAVRGLRKAGLPNTGQPK